MKNSYSINRIIIKGTILLCAILFTVSCSESEDDPGTTLTGGSGSPGPNEVFIQGMSFSPSSITVAAGTTIKWTNKDAVAHTVTSNTNAFDSGTINSNGTFSFTFATAGTFSYYCKLHPAMVAAVVVNQ
jgi:plastocyanin